MDHRLREAFADDGIVLDGVVEVDETFIGGKRKNMSNAKRKALKDTGRGSRIDRSSRSSSRSRQGRFDLASRPSRWYWKWITFYGWCGSSRIGSKFCADPLCVKYIGPFYFMGRASIGDHSRVDFSVDGWDAYPSDSLSFL